MGDASGAFVAALAHLTEASFPFPKIWSLYPAILGQAIPSAFGRFRLAVTGHLVRLEVKGLSLAWDMKVVIRANENLTGIKEDFLEFLTDPNSMWKAETDYYQNQKMRFI